MKKTRSKPSRGSIANLPLPPLPPIATLATLTPPPVCPRGTQSLISRPPDTRQAAFLGPAGKKRKDTLKLYLVCTPLSPPHVPETKVTNRHHHLCADEAGVRREWQVNVTFNNDMVEDNFAVFFFLGEPGPPSEWGTTVATVGVIYTFKAALETCKSCQDHKGQNINGTIYLTGDLRRVELRPLIDFHDLSPVSEYLTKELSWRVRKVRR